MLIVKPDTVIKWHREGFQFFWRWMSKVTLQADQRSAQKSATSSVGCT